MEFPLDHADGFRVIQSNVLLGWYSGFEPRFFKIKGDVLQAFLGCCWLTVAMSPFKFCLKSALVSLLFCYVSLPDFD